MGRRAKGVTLDVDPMIIELNQYKKGINDVINILTTIADRYDEEAKAWDDDNVIAKRLREDRSGTIRKAIKYLLDTHMGE